MLYNNLYSNTYDPKQRNHQNLSWNNGTQNVNRPLAWPTREQAPTRFDNLDEILESLAKGQMQYEVRLAPLMKTIEKTIQQQRENIYCY